MQPKTGEKASGVVEVVIDHQSGGKIELGEKIEQLSGTFDGLILGKSKPDDLVTFKTDGEDVPRRYDAPVAPGGPDHTVVAQIKNTFPPNRGRLGWRLAGGKLEVTSVVVVKPSAARGTMVGRLLEKGRAWVEVKPDDAPPERLIPNWVGGNGGGPDPNVVWMIGAVQVGDRVRVDWFFDVRRRIASIAAAR